MAQGEPQGAFVWYDLVTPDQKASAAFYDKVIGWTTQSWGDGEAPYTMWMAGETAIGGMDSSPLGLEFTKGASHWIGYIAVPDLDDALARAVKFGAAQLQPIAHVPTVGRMVLVADPMGAAFQIFTPESSAPPRSGPPGVGEIIWHELTTSNANAALDFYCTVFGWVRGTEMPVGGGTYHLFQYQGRDVGGVFTNADMPHSQWTFYPRVASAASACAAIAPAGGKVALDVMDVPSGDKIAVGFDPHGAMFGLVEPQAS